ncbi:MAG: hypothetical protein IT440_06160 [Phycisphaeraceae bacterium]|nr:hypothetical protein [Phycisphaeraceae bacterium]
MRRRANRTCVTLMCLTGMLLAGGCRSDKKLVTPILTKPSVTAVAASVVEQTDQGTRLKIVVTMANPNAVELPLRTARYTIDIAGVGPVAAEDTLSRSLPPTGAQPVEMFLAVPSMVPLQHAEYSVHGAISYEPPGEIRKVMTDSYIPLPSVGFQAAGKLD